MTKIVATINLVLLTSYIGVGYADVDCSKYLSSTARQLCTQTESALDQQINQLKNQFPSSTNNGNSSQFQMPQQEQNQSQQMPQQEQSGGSHIQYN